MENTEFNVHMFENLEHHNLESVSKGLQYYIPDEVWKARKHKAHSS
jgi:hypothetical protein